MPLRRTIAWIAPPILATGTWLILGGSVWCLLALLAGAVLAVHGLAALRRRRTARVVTGPAPAPAAAICVRPRRRAQRAPRPRRDVRCRASRRPRHARVYRRARS